MVGDRGRAQEITQDAFVQLLDHWDTVSGVSGYERPEAWVRRVAIRMAGRAARRERMVRILESGPFGRAEPTSEMPEGDSDVAAAVRRLPAGQRAAVVLFDFEDRPVVEVAELLGCSPRDRAGAPAPGPAPTRLLTAVAVAGAGCTRAAPARDDDGRAFSAVNCPAEVSALLVAEATCGYLTVPEDRATPGRTIRLFVTSVAAPVGATPAEPILVVGTDLGDVPNIAGIAPLAQRTGREVIVLDARGWAAPSRP